MLDPALMILDVWSAILKYPNHFRLFAQALPGSPAAWPALLNKWNVALLRATSISINGGRLPAMRWREYHEATKHSVESLRRARRVLDWANMPDPFRHYEGVPVLDLPADPPAPEMPASENADVAALYSVKSRVTSSMFGIIKTPGAKWQDPDLSRRISS